MTSQRPIIDADSHVEEPDEIWNYIEAPFADRRPQLVSLEGTPGVTDMDHFWLIESRLYPRPTGHRPSIAGTPITSSFARRKPFTAGSQTLMNIDERLADLDRFGIDIQVNFPTLMNEPLTEDVQFEAALMRAYNSWAADRGKLSSRLKWAAVLPLATVDQAAAEVRRVKELGASCVAVYGTNGTMMLHDKTMDPVWEACQREAMPIAVHVTHSHPGLHQSCDSIYAANVWGAAMPVLLGFYSFLGGGILDRFPNLRVGFFEAGGDWLPYYMQRLDHYYRIGERFPGWYGIPQKNPMEHLESGNIYLAVEADEQLLPQVIALLGEGQVLLTADMPHTEARDNSLSEIHDRGDLSEAVTAKLLTDNPVRFYNL